MLRPELEHFARIMEGRLKENDDKLGWKEDTPHSLFGLLAKKAGELCAAISNKDPETTIRKAADVANYAMMIADVVDQTPYPPGDGDLHERIKHLEDELIKRVRERIRILRSPEYYRQQQEELRILEKSLRNEDP